MSVCIPASDLLQEGGNAIGGADGPLTAEDIDTSNGVMFVFYDSATNVVFLAGKVRHIDSEA